MAVLNPEKGQETPRLSQMLMAQGRVILALMLRDIKTRWGSAPAYVITFLFPLVHIMALVGIWVAMDRLSPYGESNILWFSVSMVPFIAFSYVSRFLLIHVLHNRVVLAFPIFKVTDILFSGVILEIINATVMICILAIILWSLGVDFAPTNLREACLALGAAILLGLGAGIMNALIGIIIPMWVTGYFLFIIIIWMTSGVLFLPSSMPEYLHGFLYLQPVVHLVEWMRTAYYPGYNSPILDKPFVVGYALVLIAAGLAIERFARGRIVLQ
jgi:capsular polysaccharide transport system permease protein